VTDQVSHPYQTTCKIIVIEYYKLYIYTYQTGRQNMLYRMVKGNA